MVDMESVRESLFRAVDALNETLPREHRLEKQEDTRLMGSVAIDSLSLVNLIVETEMAIEEDFGRTVNLADETAMARGENPFATLGSLAEYILHLLDH